MLLSLIWGEFDRVMTATPKAERTMALNSETEIPY